MKKALLFAAALGLSLPVVAHAEDNTEMHHEGERGHHHGRNHGDHEHGDREQGDREHGDHEHGDHEHGDHEHGDHAQQ